MTSLSIITPSRNNRKYLQWSYNSVRKHAGYYPEYCVASDFSNDDTVAWCEETSKKDPNFKYIVNDGTWFGENSGKLDRMGHCRLYDVLINEIASNNIFLILHADMYLDKDMIENMLKHLETGTIVSGTRIEPPIHPKDLAKIQKDFGLEPSEFNDLALQNYTEELKSKYRNHHTEGFFAPWMCYKSDFQAVGGHDQKTFAYQSREDTDIAVRFLLNGYKLIQSWDAFCYHLTMRGSRRNPFLTDAYNDSNEWQKHNIKSERNYIRKWGRFPKHDEYMKPIIPHKYNIAFIVKNSNKHLIKLLEPYCSVLYLDTDYQDYIKDEQPNTIYDLTKRLQPYASGKNEGIIMEFDGSKLTQNSYNIIQNLPDIITDSGVVGETMQLDIFTLTINSMKTYEHELIIADKSGNLR